MWIQITEADLLTTMNAAELAGIREAALAEGQADPVQPTLDQVTNQVRGYLGTRYQLGPSGTISDKVLSAALDIIAVRIPMRVGQDASEGRVDLKDDAIRYLEQVSHAKIDIEEPLIPSTEVSGLSGGVSIVKSRPQRAGASDLLGL